MGVEAASSLAAEWDDSNRRAVELEQAHDVLFEATVVEGTALPTHERGLRLLPEERSHRLASMFGSRVIASTEYPAHRARSRSLGGKSQASESSDRTTTRPLTCIWSVRHRSSIKSTETSISFIYPDTVLLRMEYENSFQN